MHHEAKTERDLRIDLAACYRLIAHFRMTDLIYTHVSLRLPGQEGAFLINPYGLMFDEVTASNLVKIDGKGLPLEPTSYSVNPAGFAIHSAIHAAHPNAHCVLHVHSKFSCAIAAQKQGLLPINQISLEFYDQVAYHDYGGIVQDEPEQRRLLKDMADKPVLVMRNHGLLTIGESVPEAFMRAYYFEKACEIQLLAQSGQTELIFPAEEICRKTEREFNGTPDEAIDFGGDNLVWNALLRAIEKIDPSYTE